MNKKYALVFVLLYTLISPTVQADSRQLSQAKQAGALTSLAITGAVAAGPVGLFVGALCGTWISEQIERADKYDAATGALLSAKNEVSTLQRKLSLSVRETQHYARLALEQLQLELLFKTGHNQLSAAGQKRLTMLARFLDLNPTIHIRLDGYADPRGDADFNLALSKERVHAVIDALKARNISGERISSFFHGEQTSEAPPGDYDAYAMERLVRISLSNAKDAESFVHVDVQ